ncbi:MAG: hypothetical protein K9L68_00155 [Spirochaetales bacterium]|nr:hypothetical protein [Spirochaetales bacterium]MCF7936990.1 hypothetical protein [Spirochaetales bacterium]
MYKGELDLKRWGMWAIFLSVATMILGQIILYFSDFTGFQVPLILAYGFLLVVVVTVVITMIWHYKNWSILPENLRATTPGRAVGFLFIPIFNFYWIFVSFVGLWKGLNRYAPDVVGPRWEPLPLLVPKAMNILALISLILPKVPILTAALQMLTGVLALSYLLITHNRIKLVWVYSVQIPRKTERESD